MATYYVSTTGSSNNTGLSEASPWTLSHAISTAVAGDTVYIRRGTYNNTNLTINQSGTASSRIRFIGYNNTPGDIIPYQWTNGDPDPTLDSNMPIIRGTNSSQHKGLTVNGSYVHVENLQVDTFNTGFDFNGNFLTAKNLRSINNGTLTPNSVYDGFAFHVNGDDGVFEYLLSIKAASEGVNIGGANRCTVRNSTVWSKWNDDPVDYYFIIGTDSYDNVVEDCIAYRDLGNTKHHGHGFDIKDRAERNTYRRCIAYNTGIEVNFSGVQNNVFEYCEIYGKETQVNGQFSTGIRVMNGASNNTFRHIYMEDIYDAINFHNNDDGFVGPGGDRDLFQGGNNNVFYNLVVRGAKTALSHSSIVGPGDPHRNTATSDNNKIYNCTFDGLHKSAIYSYAQLRNTTMENCIFSNCTGTLWLNELDGGTVTFSSLSNCNFYNNTWSTPSGFNLTTHNPQYQDRNIGNFKLRQGSPLIDIGKTISTVTTDADGVLRPQGSGYDIGAYEYKPLTQSNLATILGELKQWHTVTLEWEHSTEQDEVIEPSADNNPTVDYRLLVTFTRPDNTTFTKQGYFAADGNAANTGATSGKKWHCKISPEQEGLWQYSVRFVYSPDIFREYPINPATGGTGYEFDGDTGSFVVGPTDKSAPDFRNKGRLQVTGGRYRQYAGTGDYFIKVGADAPETTLAYEDIDNTTAGRSNPTGGQRLKSWSPHVQDWQTGDPEWGQQKGRGLIGAVNYMASQGMNAMSMITFNISGDGDQVHPYAESDKNLLDGVGSPDVNNRLRFDVSKLEQWGIVFEHMNKKGIHVHIKLQERENDTIMENGDLGDSRKMYLQQLIARFSHLNAITWNIGEENTQTAAQERAMAKYVADLDPHNNLIVMHTYPTEQDKYNALIGNQSELTGASLQIHPMADVHAETRLWVDASANSPKTWVVACDETGPANQGVTADASYTGNKGTEPDNREETRKDLLWGALMAGAEGVEYYYGYQTGETDLTAEDHRSRATKWQDAKVAKTFFETYPQDLGATTPDDTIVTGSSNWCLKNDGVEYIVYLRNGGTASLTTTGSGSYSVAWYDPIQGGTLQNGSVTEITAGGTASLGNPPHSSSQDWVVYVQKLAGNVIYADTKYGFNATDATDHFYDAIKGEKGTGNTLIFRDMGSPWYITREVRLFDLDDITIIFEPGCVVEAKQGFWSPSMQYGGRLFNVLRGTNCTFIGYRATFKMYKSDYPTGEFGHAMSLVDMENVKVYGLTFDGSGGDELYLTQSNNVLVEDCYMKNGKRQGLSLIWGTNVTIRHCIFENTVGTDPQAGIDIEPNNAGEEIVNVLIENCQFKNNAHEAILFALSPMDGSVPDLGVTVRNCYAFGNGNRPGRSQGDVVRGAAFYFSSTDNKVEPKYDNPLPGSITLDRVYVDTNEGGGWYARKQSSPNYTVNFNDCAFHDLWQDGSTGESPFYHEVTSYTVNSRIGGMNFNNMIVDHDQTGKLFTIQGGSSLDAWEDITGNITVLAPNASAGVNYQGGYNSSRNNNITYTEDFNTSLPSTTVEISVLEQYAVKTIGQRATARITRTSAKTDYPLAVKYNIGSSATALVTQGDDIHYMPGFVIIPAGETYADIEIKARDNGKTENDRDILVTIEPRDHYTVGANSSATLTVTDSVSSPCSSDYVEEAGLVTIYPEDLTLVSSWEVATTQAGYTNTGYIRWTGADNFNTPGVGVISATIRITNPGTYRFQWYSRIGQGTSTADFNDTWLRFPDATDFYGQRGSSVVYPHGSGKTPTPNGSGSGGWFKVYLNHADWGWSTKTSDNDPHDIYVEFATPGVYTMELSARSFNHLIDRIVMYQSSVADPLNLSNADTPCTEVADNTAPNITVINHNTVTENSFKVDWTLDEAGTGQVEYGTTPSYGQTTTLETAFLSRHIQTVSGLQPNTLYYYRVTGQDASGNVYTGAQRTVTTNAAAVPETGVKLRNTQVGTSSIKNTQIGNNSIPDAD